MNAIGSAVVAGGPYFWAAPFERDAEFGGLGLPVRFPADPPPWKGSAEPATTVAIVATDATLTKAAAQRLAIVASAGLARALRVAFAPADGDTIFAVSTRRRPPSEDDLTELGIVAADCLTRAIARGVYEATPLGRAGELPSWQSKYGTIEGVWRRLPQHDTSVCASSEGTRDFGKFYFYPMGFGLTPLPVYEWEPASLVTRPFNDPPP